MGMESRIEALEQSRQGKASKYAFVVEGPGQSHLPEYCQYEGRKWNREQAETHEQFQERVERELRKLLPSTTSLIFMDEVMMRL